MYIYTDVYYIQLEHTKLEEEFFAEVAALEAKYAARHRPLLDKVS